MKFKEHIGRASTSAWRNGKYLGHNVKAVAYINGSDITIKLESGMSPVEGVSSITMAKDKYEGWKDSCPEGLHLMLHGLRLFDCSTSFDAE